MTRAVRRALLHATRPLRDTGAMTYASDWAIHTLRELVPPDTQIPVYGSDAWAALPADSPLRLAAAIRAAETWRADGDRAAERLAAELDAERNTTRAELIDRVGAIAYASAHRLTTGSSYAQLAAARGEPGKATAARTRAARSAAAAPKVPAARRRVRLTGNTTHG